MMFIRSRDIITDKIDRYGLEPVQIHIAELRIVALNAPQSRALGPASALPRPEPPWRHPLGLGSRQSTVTLGETRR